MTTLNIHKLDPAVERQLRDRAARRGHSVEEEVAHILAEAIGKTEDEPQNAYEAMRRHFRDLEGADMDRPIRRPPRRLRKSRLSINWVSWTRKAFQETLSSPI